MCIFLFQAAKAVFPDVKNPREDEIGDSLTDMLTANHTSHPMVSLIKRLNELVIQPMASSNVEPVIRAAALLEVLDGILMVPYPFPPDFFIPSPSIITNIESITAVGEPGQQMSRRPRKSIGVFPGLSFSICCKGHVTVDLLSHFKMPCWTLIVRFSLEYESPLEEDEVEDTKIEEEYTATNSINIDITSREMVAKSLKKHSSFATSEISSDGKCYTLIYIPPIIEEGLYTLHLKFGLIDVAGLEWELMVPAEYCLRPIRVSRSL